PRSESGRRRRAARCPILGAETSREVGPPRGAVWLSRVCEPFYNTPVRLPGGDARGAVDVRRLRGYCTAPVRPGARLARVHAVRRRDEAARLTRKESHATQEDRAHR